MDNLWNDEHRDETRELVGQLVLDPQFRMWVLHPTPESEAYWIDYLNVGLPDREEAVRQARLIVLALQMPDYAVPPETVQAKTDQLLRRIRSEQADQPTSRPLYLTRWRWLVAASVLLVLGWWWALRLPTAETAPRMTSQTETQLPLVELSGTVVEESTTQTTRRIMLPDGSLVTLQPKSQLRYSKTFGPSNRVVTLRGQAFFEVVHNPQKPFLVFTNNLVTRVLGTSFTVTTRQGQPSRVSVRTGKVAVYTRQAFAQINRQPTDELLLTPNQQATIDKTGSSLTKTLVADPVPIPAGGAITMNFENRPVIEVIDGLEKLYGIQITCDRERLSRCRVTVLLENEPLFDQLTLLCKLIDGHYQTVDTNITLSSDGCP